MARIITFNCVKDGVATEATSHAIYVYVVAASVFPNIDATTTIGYVYVYQLHHYYDTYHYNRYRIRRNTDRGNDIFQICDMSLPPCVPNIGTVTTIDGCYLDY